MTDVLMAGKFLHEDAVEARRERDVAVASLNIETQRRERFEEEVESLHKWLDQRGAPRTERGAKLSLIGRVTSLINA